MSITTTVTETLDKVQEQTLSLIDTGQGSALKAIDAVVEFLDENAPDVELDLELVRLPGVVADKGFAFAEQVLGSSRKFVAEAFAKIEPLLAAAPVVEAVSDEAAA